MLIGSIAINLKASTGELAKGLAKASTMVQSWSSAVSKDFGAGSRSIAKGLAKVADAGESMGYLLRDSFKGGTGNLGPLAIQLTRVGSGAGQAGGGLARIGWGVAKVGASKLQTSLVSVGSSLAKVGAAAVVAGGILGVKAAGEAAHLTETYNKTNQVFGESGAGVIATAENMNKAFGVSRKEFLDGASALGGMLQGMGYAQTDAATLSTSLSQLAADAAAFRDVPLDQALQKIRSGLSGEAEPLKEWGILIDEASVENEALTLGLVKQGEALDNAAKVQARMSLIQKGLAKDSGALNRESTGTAAQMAELWGRLETLWETLGSTVAPALGLGLQAVNTALLAGSLAWQDLTTWISSTMAEALGGLDVAGVATSAWNGAVGLVTKSWYALKGAALEVFSYIQSGVGKVASGLASVLEAMARIGAGQWARTAAGNLREFASQAEQISKGSAAKAQEAFSAMFSPSGKAEEGYLARARKEIEEAKAKLEAQRTAPLAVAGPQRQQEQKTAEKAAEKAVEDKPKEDRDRFAGAYAAGSKEAADIVLKSRYGVGKDDSAKAAKATADNTGKMVAAQVDLGRKFGEWLTKQSAAVVVEVVNL
ncbi:hypothetical protein [Paludisphaera rhizosphaerae]|uniref:hypothetical protein n=1 Tax=Paludisphaera rhizosphaerae TaxID=2711216 RepID=UPI0013EC4A91|nr:hypothetical protein [Paludisphaera rhizosphaerae]